MGAVLRALFAFVALVAALPAFAQLNAQFKYPYDVPYVWTPYVVVEEMLRLAKVKADDFLIDLGSGDGRIAIAAAKKFGARAVGVDLDAERIAESEANLEAAGVGDRVQFFRRDLFTFDISQATVVTMYLIPSVNAKLRPRLLAELKPGTRIVSHDFDFGDWKPDAQSTVRKNVFLWIVPAQIAGRWTTTVALPARQRTYEIEIKQEFQQIDATVRYEKKIANIWNAKLEGDRVSFVIVDDSRDIETNLYFEGRVAGGTMEGVIRRGIGADETTIKWRAVRVEGPQ